MYQVRVHLGLQEQSVLKWTPSTNTNSFSMFYICTEKIKILPYQWYWFHVKVPSESTEIIETSGCP
jgi:hypothetical protein